MKAAFRREACETPPQLGEVSQSSPPPEGAADLEKLKLSHGHCESGHYQMLGKLDWLHKSWNWQSWAEWGGKSGVPMTARRSSKNITSYAASKTPHVATLRW